jgi:hypothetical protein
VAVTPLTSADFRNYPPQAQALVENNLALLQQLPQTFLSLLMREVIVYDWKFPAERDEIDRQLRFLSGLSPDGLSNTMGAFRRIELSPELQQSSWIANPQRFSERLSAHLWATHQIDDFTAAAESFIAAFNTAVPEKPAAAPRLGIVVVGHELNRDAYPLFRKLRSRGTYFSNVDTGDNYQTLLDVVKNRAEEYPAPYAHWCIHGGDPVAANELGRQIAALDYASLSTVREDLIHKMQQNAGTHFSPEAVRTQLAETDPAAVGLAGHGIDPVLSHFSVRVLTEGSGTQIYSTTFVQWAAREALRRARPITLLAKFAPRQTEESADEQLQGIQKKATLDPAGSLVDADMGAFYTWINLQRLSGADDAKFLAWFEGHGQAVAIAPGLPAGKVSADKVDLAELIRRMQVIST